MAPDIKLVIRIILLGAAGPLILFLAAGDLRWTWGWIFSAFAFVYTLYSRWAVFRKHPDLIPERADSLKKENVEPWDRVLMPLVGLILPTAVVIVAGLDHRFRWSPELPPGVPVAALIVMSLGALLAQWAVMANRFFSGIVRIQHERGQTVVTTGPYRYLRHPGYAGGLLFQFAIPFALGTLWPLLPTLAALALIVLRTSLEDRTLIQKLPGYVEYAKRTRRRLIPGIW
jgi:protein-S-isoprenylcysteine O-methyltransferase Ste14